MNASKLVINFCCTSIIMSSCFAVQKRNNTIKKAPQEKTVITAPKKIERTLALIKPDAVRAHHTGTIIKLIELNKFAIARMKKVQLTHKQAETFYRMHKDKPFFGELIKYMTSGPVIALALEKEQAIKEWRELMGTTNPEKAAPGTLRRMFGTSLTYNAAHGSDSPEAASCELIFFFPDLQYN